MIIVCLTLTEGKRLFWKFSKGFVCLFDELGNAEVDDVVVISLYIRSDRFHYAVLL